MKPSMFGTISVCMVYSFHLGIFHNSEATSTVYGRQGHSVTLSWTQYPPGVREFTVKDESQNKNLLNVTDYTTLEHNFGKRIQFTGNLTSQGVGVFRFILRDVQLTDAGRYRCFRSGPGRNWIPECGVDLDVIQVHTHFTLVPDTVAPGSSSVRLSCYTSILPKNRHLEIRFTWREDDVTLVEGERYNMIANMMIWNTWKYFYSNLTITGVEKKDCGHRYSCQAVFEGQIRSSWSEEYVLGKDYSRSEHKDVTYAREGTNAVMTWNMPLIVSDVNIKSPADETVISVNPSKIYAWRSDTLRWRIAQVVSSSSSTTAHIVLNNVTSSDVGMYYCTKADGSRVSGCGHRLDLVSTDMSRTSNTDDGNQTCSLNKEPAANPPNTVSPADGRVFSASAFAGCVVVTMFSSCVL
ncbi:uncharacterized protein [Haliotis cracherodii]|uniref:uncharacterized protein n=1 Tax=Haliotis cracherodii TaxID=6455 RepID=UPI0039E944E8